MLCSFPVYSSAAGGSDTTIQPGVQTEDIDIILEEEFSSEEAEENGQGDAGEGSAVEGGNAAEGGMADGNAEGGEDAYGIISEDGTDTAVDGEGESAGTEETEVIMAV